MDRGKVFQMIDDERVNQQLLGRSDSHDLQTWLSIMNDYLGEAMDLADDGYPAEAENVLVQVVALGVAALEEHGCIARTNKE